MAQRNPEVIDEVVQEIYELSPDELVPELRSFLQGHYLSKMVATHGAIQASKAMLAVELTIPKADTPDERTALGTFAVGAIGGILHHADYTADTFEAALVLVTQKGRYANLIEDADEKSTQLGYVAQTAYRISENYTTERDTLSFWQLYNTYLDEAVAAALAIDDAELRAARLTHLATTATGNMHLGLSLSADSEQKDAIINNMVDQPVAIYEKALSAAAGISDRDKRVSAQAWNVISMVQKAGYENEINPGQSRRLVNMAVVEIGNILAEYSADSEGAAYNLVQLAGKLSETIFSKYDALVHNPDLRQQLVDQVMCLFSDAGDYILDDGQVSRDRRLYRETDFSHRYTWVAKCLADSDFESARELFSLGFEIAALHDNAHKKESHRVLLDIDELAGKQTTIRETFELKSLAFRLERDHTTGDEISDTLSQNVIYDFSTFDEFPHEEIALEDIDREFVEFIIDDPRAVKKEVCMSRIRCLDAMDRYVQDPELKRRIEDQITILQDYFEAMRYPTGRLGALAKEHWPHP